MYILHTLSTLSINLMPSSFPIINFYVLCMYIYTCGQMYGKYDLLIEIYTIFSSFFMRAHVTMYLYVPFHVHARA